MKIIKIENCRECNYSVIINDIERPSKIYCCYSEEHFKIDNFSIIHPDCKLEDYPDIEAERKAKEEAQKTSNNAMQVLNDMCDDEEEIRKLARQYLSEEDAYGDKYGVVPIVEVVEKLVEKYKLWMYLAKPDKEKP